MPYTFTLDGSKFDFSCDSIGTRSGFAHIVTLYKDNNEISCGRANYINRTWESYRYQTAMINTVDSAISYRRDRLKYWYKYDHKIPKVSRKIMEEIYEQDPFLLLLSKLRKHVMEYR